MKINILILFLSSLSFVACNEEEQAEVRRSAYSGSADFTKYVALGDSYAAGYSDGSLFKTGQSNSYPNIIAKQMAQAGGGIFNTPFMADNIGGFTPSASFPAFTPRLILKGFYDATTPNLDFVSPHGTQTTNVANHLQGFYNNMGIPGAKSFHLLAPGYGGPSGNPYFSRFSSSPLATVVDDALAQNPTFFSLWIGGNDFLSYAMEGGVRLDKNASENPVDPKYNENANDGGANITDYATFDASFNAIVTKMAKGGRKGVLANYASLTALPFFTTVGSVPITLLSEQDATALNAKYASNNTSLVAAKDAGTISESERVQRTIIFKKGANPAVINDEYLTALPNGVAKIRQTTAKDYILLNVGAVSAMAHLKAGNGTVFPLVDKWVLSKDEVLEVNAATDHYNATILAAAKSNDLAFLDAKVVLEQLLGTGGFRFGNYHMTASYITGGTFSLDGFHPSARGYALIANEFLEAINKKYGSTLKPVDLGSYPTQYPASL